MFFLLDKSYIHLFIHNYKFLLSRLVSTSICICIFIFNFISTSSFILLPFYFTIRFHFHFTFTLLFECIYIIIFVPIFASISILFYILCNKFYILYFTFKILHFTFLLSFQNYNFLFNMIKSYCVPLPSSFYREKAIYGIGKR